MEQAPRILYQWRNGKEYKTTINTNRKPLYQMVLKALIPYIEG